MGAGVPRGGSVTGRPDRYSYNGEHGAEPVVPEPSRTKIDRESMLAAAKAADYSKFHDPENARAEALARVDKGMPSYVPEAGGDARPGRYMGPDETRQDQHKTAVAGPAPTGGHTAMSTFTPAPKTAGVFDENGAANDNAVPMGEYNGDTGTSTSHWGKSETQGPDVTAERQGLRTAAQHEMEAKAAQGSAEMDENYRQGNQQTLDTLGKQADLVSDRARSEQRDVQQRTADREKQDADRTALDEAANRDPKHFWHSQSTGQKIGHIIALALGGFTAGMKGGPNEAMEMFQRQIDADNAQQDKTLNARQKFAAAKGEDAHELLARNQQKAAEDAQRTAQKWGLIKEQFDAEALKHQNPAIRARIQAEGAEIEGKLAHAQLQAAEATGKHTTTTSGGSYTSGPKQRGIDPDEKLAGRRVRMPGGKNLIAKDPGEASKLQQKINAHEELKSMLTEAKRLRNIAYGPVNDINPRERYAALEALNGLQKDAVLTGGRLGATTIRNFDVKSFEDQVGHLGSLSPAAMARFEGLLREANTGINQETGGLEEANMETAKDQKGHVHNTLRRTGGFYEPANDNGGGGAGLSTLKSGTGNK